MNDMGSQKEGIQAADRVFRNIESAKTDPIDGLSVEGIVPSKSIQGKLELINVSFSYPNRKNVQIFKNYNLIVEPGETLALVGPSGSGKSTIMALLLRFYDPDEGEILLDGINLKSLNIRWLRSQFGYVGQEPTLFVGTVEDNIKNGVVDDSVDYKKNPVISYEDFVEQHRSNALNGHTDVPTDGDVEMGSRRNDVVEACIKSNAHNFILSFPQGYKTDVGEGSIMVSGGQKQRIAIARAIIKNPAVLLFDEATSALDAASEKFVQESIDMLQASTTQTKIIIAHRLVTIRNANKIAVVDHGSIVEYGNHDALLDLNGIYTKMWSKQNSDFSRGGLDLSRQSSFKLLSENNTPLPSPALRDGSLWGENSSPTKKS